MSKAYKCVASLGVAALGAGVSFAGPIPPSPSPVPSSGESFWDSFPSAATDAGLNVDWMVYQLGAGNPFGSAYVGEYVYLYQLEVNSAAVTGPSLFSVTFNTALAGVSVGDAGFLVGDDLDLMTGNHAAHNLAGETDTFALQNTVPPNDVDVTSGNVTWHFPDISQGEESDTLYFISPLPPIYGEGNAADSTLPSPWGSLAPGSQPVPVPAPEPSEYLMAGLGLLGLGYFIRRKKLAMA